MLSDLLSLVYGTSRLWVLICFCHTWRLHPPWLSPLCKLLKLAVEYRLISKDRRSNDGILMWLGVFLINLMTLLADIMSEMVAVLIFILISETWKLISGRGIPATQFNFPSAHLSSVVSSLESGRLSCLDCSGLIGIRLMVLMYWFWSSMIEQLVFCRRWTPM